MKPSRRKFVKSMLTVPFMAAGLNSFSSQTRAVNKKYGHKFKISLNVFSFNQPLRDGKIDLFDVLGKKINSINGSKENSINLSGIKAGVYFVRVFSENGNLIFTKKLIKSN